jgi:predicted GNAT family N-acyltransferase
VEYASFEYFEAVKLRDAVLRAPLGLSLSCEDLEGESEHSFFVALLHGAVVGCLALTPQIDGQVQMRQVAVDPSLQGSGIGRSLVQAAELYASRQRLSRIVLHARETATQFYKQLGYRVEGEPFVEVGIPHRFMEKTLA